MGVYIATIVGMGSLGVVSSYVQGILTGQGRQTESTYVDLGTKSALIITSATLFVKAVKTLMQLG